MGTQSFTILLHDPDPVVNKSASNDVTHWMIFNIPGTATSLGAGVAAGDLPDGSKQAANITGQPSYFGPAPPAGRQAAWIPTCPGIGWEAILRLRGAGPEWRAGGWMPGDLEPR